MSTSPSGPRKCDSLWEAALPHCALTLTLLLCRLSLTHVLGAGGRVPRMPPPRYARTKPPGLLRTRAPQSPLLCLGTRIIGEVLHGDAPHTQQFFKAGISAIAPRSCRKAHALGSPRWWRRPMRPGCAAMRERRSMQMGVCPRGRRAGGEPRSCVTAARCRRLAWDAIWIRSASGDSE